MDVYDVIIIGAGPAGLTAGLYAGRFGLKTLILEKINIGGQIILSSTIENFPGFPGGVSTQELIDRFKRQVDDVGVKVEFEEVVGVEESFRLQVPLYNIKTKDDSYETKSVIVASGAQSKKLDVEGEDKFIGRGVSYCGTCDGPLFKDKEVMVIGGGDRAIEEAIFLTTYAKKVNIVHRRHQLRASNILEAKVKQNHKINFILDTILEKIDGKDRVEEVRLKNVINNSVNVIACQGVFIFVGITPNTHFLKNFLQMDESGFIITDQNLKSSSNGIFACGDCRKKSLYQVINACAEGALAADSAQKYVMEK